MGMFAMSDSRFGKGILFFGAQREDSFLGERASSLALHIQLQQALAEPLNDNIRQDSVSSERIGRLKVGAIASAVH